MESRINGKQNPEYYKLYYQKNKDSILGLNKKRYKSKRNTAEGLKEHRERSTEATRRYRLRHPERVRELRRKIYISRKKRAMELIGGAKCSRCGCDVIEFLEFNHIDGGGCKEIKKGKHVYMADRLLSGKRSPNGLDILCRICNALDFLERKNKEQSKRFKIRWETFTEKKAKRL